MISDRKYIIRFLDDTEELEVIFLRSERGFYIFKSIIEGKIVVARPSSISVREK